MTAVVSLPCDISKKLNKDIIYEIIHDCQLPLYLPTVTKTIEVELDMYVYRTLVSRVYSILRDIWEKVQSEMMVDDILISRGFIKIKMKGCDDGFLYR